ncbi:helix-turn-helix transcriptional regulator [Streptomyces sp. WG7]|uniref:helix-turn-helix transcriptional regulator n=1 Tax=Streptomyces sp. WG7 TaxID=3417650 RepID=UPI003CF528C6
MDSQVLMELSRAIHARQELRFDHTPGPGAASGASRRAEHHHLVTWRHRWYLVAFDLDRDDWRTFRVDRIRPRTPPAPASPRANSPAATSPRSSPAASAATTAPPPTGPAEATSSSLSRPPTSPPSPRTPSSRNFGPHHCRLTLGSWSWSGLASAFGHFDTDVTIVGPPQLAAAFADLAARYTRAAGSEGGPPP